MPYTRKFITFKKLLFAMVFMWSNPAWTYVITIDEVAFLSQFENPTEIINFDTLRDGTTFSDVDGHNPYWTGQQIAGELVIYENGWSDYYFIRSAFNANPNNNHYWRATNWNGNSITPDKEFLSIYTNDDSYPIALYTTNGFVGVIPDSPLDRHFVLTDVIGGSTRVFQIQAGFSSVPTPTPEPTTLALICLGLAGIGFGRYRSKKSA